jgi:hypothetical protein
MIMKKILAMACTAILMLVYTSCQYVDIVPDDGSGVEISDKLSFSADVEPIFKTQSCTNCHPGMKQPNLTEGNAYKSLMDGGYIDEKNPENSSLLVVADPGGSHAAKLTAAQVKIITAWIEQGAKDN